MHREVRTGVQREGGGEWGLGVQRRGPEVLSGCALQRREANGLRRVAAAPGAAPSDEGPQGGALLAKDGLGRQTQTPLNSHAHAFAFRRSCLLRPHSRGTLQQLLPHQLLLLRLLRRLLLRLRRRLLRLLRFGGFLYLLLGGRLELLR